MYPVYLISKEHDVDVMKILVEKQSICYFKNKSDSRMCVTHFFFYVYSPRYDIRKTKLLFVA